VENAKTFWTSLESSAGDTVKAASIENQGIKLQEKETKEWIETDKAGAIKDGQVINTHKSRKVKSWRFCERGFVCRKGESLEFS
jgi:hypothetical protein